MERETQEQKGLSRREFLKDAGLIVGGATVGSVALLSACGGETTRTVTVTSAPTSPAAQTTVTQPVGGAAVTNLTVNGKAYALPNLAHTWSLAHVLREQLGLTGTKTGCNRGECGTCTVIMNDRAVYSCMVLAVQAEGAKVQTVEGLSDGINFTGVQKAIYDTDALQCGYCAPGFIMAATALLAAKPKPTLDEVRTALSGHQCTCGNTKQYVEAVLKV